MPLQFFPELGMVIDQNQIDKLFPLEISSLDFSFITSVEDSFNLRIFFFTLEDIFTLNYLYGDCLLEVKSIVKIGTFDKTIRSCFNLTLFSTLIYI